MFPFSNAIFPLPTVAFSATRTKNPLPLKLFRPQEFVPFDLGGNPKKKILEKDFPSFSLLVLSTELSPAVLADFESDAADGFLV